VIVLTSIIRFSPDDHLFNPVAFQKFLQPK